MKTLNIIIVLIFFHSFTSNAEAEKLKKWGYIPHYSKLNKIYLNKTIPNMDVVSITGFKLNATGKLDYKKSVLFDRVIRTSKINKTKIYPHISFKSVSTGKKILDSSKLRKISINSISGLIKKYNFKGINLDFEYLPANYSIKLSRFLFELKKKSDNTVITMAVFPSIDFPEKWSGFHNLKHISPYLDAIIIMCYDYHRPGTKPGPVTDINWAEKNVLLALKFIKPDKIWLGIPSYGYRWSSNGTTKVVSSRYGLKLAKKYGYRRHISGNVFISYKKGKKDYKIYFSDKNTREKLMRLAERYKLKGTALWRLGFEE